MPQLRMVVVATLSSQFQAQVVAARLGAEGIVWQLRGACSVYPVGNVDVLVDHADLDRARELLLVDEVEAAFEHHGAGFAEGTGTPEPGQDDSPPVSGRRAAWWAWAMAVAALTGLAVRLLSWLWA